MTDSHCSSNSCNNNNNNKPIVPPKPKLNSIHDKANYNRIISNLKEKMLNLSNNNNDDLNNQATFNLLDEIYAEIEDKQLKLTIKEKQKPIINNKYYCASQSCSSSSYTSASSSHSSSNQSCTCCYSSSSLIYTPPPLPSMPPPPLTPTNSTKLKSRSSSRASTSTPDTCLPLATGANTNAVASIDSIVTEEEEEEEAISKSLSLEEEIEMEIRNKFSVLLKKSAETDFIEPEESIEDQINNNDKTHENEQDIETDYLEPVNLISSSNNNNNKETKIITNQTSQIKSISAILSPSYRLKSYIQTKLNKETTNTNKNLNQVSSLNYLLKQSNKLSSHLRFKRNSTSKLSLNQVEIQPQLECNYNRNSNSISGPILISQTFDINNQYLIDINNKTKNNEDNESFSTTSSFSSSSSSSNSSKLEIIYQTEAESSTTAWSRSQDGINVYEEQFDINLTSNDGTIHYYFFIYTFINYKMRVSHELKLHLLKFDFLFLT